MKEWMKPHHSLCFIFSLMSLLMFLLRGSAIMDRDPKARWPNSLKSNNRKNGEEIDVLLIRQVRSERKELNRNRMKRKFRTVWCESTWWGSTVFYQFQFPSRISRRSDRIWSDLHCSQRTRVQCSAIQTDPIPCSTVQDRTAPDLPWNQASTSPFDILSAADATMSSSLLCSFTITNGSLDSGWMMVEERERGRKEGRKRGQGEKERRKLHNVEEIGEERIKG